MATWAPPGLLIGVEDFEPAWNLFDGPRRRQAAVGHGQRPQRTSVGNAVEREARRQANETWLMEEILTNTKSR
jgi:hypothetical protein